MKAQAIMKPDGRISLLTLAVLLLAAGCSVFPGARVLFGQEDAAVVAESVGDVELVMADKTSTVNPSLAAAADRIEMANSGAVDIVELRDNSAGGIFTVFMLLDIPQNASNLEQVNIIKRAFELTWQGLMRESQGRDILDIEVLFPGMVPTLDNGPSFIGQIVLSGQISRDAAVQYLNHRPNTAQDFVNLILDGNLTVDSPTEAVFYDGQPNHPVFMLAQLQASAAAQGG